MKQTGILFTPDNIRAIREGRKTQTRRVITPQPSKTVTSAGCLNGREWHWMSGDPRDCDTWVLEGDGWFKCLQGIPGDRLYIKEGIIRHASIPQLVGYYMDGCRVTESWEKRSTAMFMPKWAARTWLELADVRVERLQDISEEDAIAEGIERTNDPDGWKDYRPSYFCNWKPEYPIQSYRTLWESINAKKHPWASNPWVWALTFREVPA